MDKSWCELDYRASKATLKGGALKDGISSSNESAQLGGFQDDQSPFLKVTIYIIRS